MVRKVADTTTAQRWTNSPFVKDSEPIEMLKY